MIRRRLAWSLAVADMLVLFLAVVFDPEPDLVAISLFTLGIGAYVGIGMLLISRVPANPIGVLLLTTGTFGVATVAIATYADLGSNQAPPWPGVALAGTVAEAMFIYPILIALVLIPLVFPDGRLPSRRFRWVALLTIAGMIGWLLGSVFRVSVDVVVLLSVPVAFGGAVTAVVLRFRRGDAIQRQQVKWLAAVVVVGATAVLAGLFLNEAAPDLSRALIALGIVALFSMPFVIGIAILRYRLYEIDRIVSRTIAYTIVTGLLAATFAVIVLVLQTLLASWAQIDSVAVAASTLAVFALFQPVLRRVRHAVDRQFDRARYDAEGTAVAFSDRLRHEVDMEAVATDLRSTIAASVAPATLAIWLRPGRGGR